MNCLQSCGTKKLQNEFAYDNNFTYNLILNINNFSSSFSIKWKSFKICIQSFHFIRFFMVFCCEEGMVCEYCNMPCIKRPLHLIKRLFLYLSDLLMQVSPYHFCWLCLYTVVIITLCIIISIGYWFLYLHFSEGEGHLHLSLSVHTYKYLSCYVKNR